MARRRTRVFQEYVYSLAVVNYRTGISTVYEPASKNLASVKKQCLAAAKKFICGRARYRIEEYNYGYVIKRISNGEPLVSYGVHDAYAD